MAGDSCFSMASIGNTGLIKFREPLPKAQPAEWRRRLRLISHDLDESVCLFKGRSTTTIPAVGPPRRTNASEMIWVEDWERFEQQTPRGGVVIGSAVSLMDKKTSISLLVFSETTGQYQRTGQMLPTKVRDIVEKFSGEWSRIRDKSSLYADPELDPTAHC